MAEQTSLGKTIAAVASYEEWRGEHKEDRFGFIFTINDYIVCKRFFGINNFQERSLGSVHLMDAMSDCVKMIKEDLEEKTNIYNILTAPQVFQNIEEMQKWVENPTFPIDPLTYVIFRDSEDVFIWNGTEMQTYGRPFNRIDYVGEQDAQPCTLRLAFLVDGEEVAYQSWDGTQYPRFVRNNIDLSNSRNKYEQEGNFSAYEAFIINQFNKGRQDLIQAIKRRLNYACNGENVRYFSKLHYGDKEYDVNLKGYNERLFIGLRKGKK